MNSNTTHLPTPPVRRRLRAGVFLLLILVMISWFALHSHAKAPVPAPKIAPAVPATLVQVAREDVPNFLLGVGTVQANATVTVRTQLDGELERVDYVEGEDVKAGQVLAQIDARALRARLEQVQAQKAKDSAQLTNARLNLSRYAQLIKENAITQQALDTQRALLAQLQATIQNDEALVHFAEVQLGYATITTPLAGRVGARLVDPGNIVHVDDATGLVVVNQIDPIAVVFTLPGDEVQAINRAQQPNQRLAVLVYARDGEELLARGELVLVNNQIDVTSGTIQLKAQFGNPRHVLWPGQFVNVRLLLGEQVQALTVPAEVVQRSQSGTYAYVIAADGKAQMRPIQVLQIRDGKAVIAKGLKEGETVVLSGQYKIKPGISVIAAVSDRAGAASAASDAVSVVKR